MTGANLTQIHAIHFTPFFWIDNTKQTLTDQLTVIDMYNSVSATKNVIRITGYKTPTDTTAGSKYTASGTTSTVDLYRTVEIQAKVTEDGVEKLKCFPRWILHKENITVTDGEIAIIADLPAACYKVVPKDTNLTINVSFFDEPRYTNPGYVKGTYGTPTSVVTDANYTIPSAETIA